MKRDKMITKMFEKMNQITGKNSNKWTWDAECEVWNMCNDWNREHYNGRFDEAEIFMCEDWDEDGNKLIYIEDDSFVIYAD
jgi:hypothetical protein